MPLVVQSVDAEVAEAVAWHLEPFALDPSRSLGGGLQVQVYVQEEDADLDPPVLSYFSAGLLRARSARRPELLAVLLDDVYGSVRRYLRDFLLVSGGAAARNGTTAVMVGDGTPEDSLRLLGLLQSGWAHVSDGDVAVDPVTARVYPYPKPIRLAGEDLAGWPGILSGDPDAVLPPDIRLPEGYLRPSEIGVQLVPGPSRPRAIVVATSGRGSGPILSPLAPHEAVSELLARCENRKYYPDLAQVLIQRLVEGAEFLWKLEGGSPTEQAFLLDERLR